MKRSLLIIVCFLCAAGASAHADSVQFEWTGFFARKLSTYKLFADPVRQIPNEGLLPYDIITPLFSDYAHKQRFIYLPPGGIIEYSATDAFTFPVCSAIVKTFYYPEDFRKPTEQWRLIETRLLVHTEKKGWMGAAYVWNEGQTDAELSVIGKRLPVEWTHLDGKHRTTEYTIPNMNQCRFCHAGHGENKPLSPTARQLNHDYAYADGHTANQLAEWTRRGILSGAPKPQEAPRVAPMG